MEMGAKDSNINDRREIDTDSSSWAQLEISPNIVGSILYSNFRINIYEHARNTKMHKKYYYVPIAMLDSNSAHSSKKKNNIHKQSI